MQIIIAAKNRIRSLAFILTGGLLWTGAPLMAGPSSAYQPVSHASADMIRERAADMNRFAFELYQRLLPANTERNLVFSPLSVQSAFALLVPATTDHSLAGSQLQSAMHFTEPQSACHEALKGYLLHLGSIFSQRIDNRRLAWHLADDIWVDKKFGLQPEYLNTVKSFYDTDVRQLDLASSPAAGEASRTAINRYVAERTNNLIRGLLPPGALNGESKVVLTNAVYMLADWKEPFGRSATRSDTFYPFGGPPEQVAMMKRTGRYLYLENDLFSAISVPYSGGELAVLFLLPANEEPLVGFAAGWDAGRLQDVLASLQPARVALTLPKFRFTWGSASLTKPLQQLGLSALFDSNSDPLTGILTQNLAPLRGGVAIQELFHQATIIVDEKGTEAAAATGGVIGYTSAERPDEPVKTFKVDHPAMFAIYDTKYHGILFVGHLADPLAR